MKTNLTFEEAKQVGRFDSKGRFFIDEQFHTETSRCVRTPSKAWHNSELKHAMTQKYFKSLSDSQKELLGI